MLRFRLTAGKFVSLCCRADNIRPYNKNALPFFMPRRVRRTAANKLKSVFGRGVYVDENTSQAASVELVCL